MVLTKESFPPLIELPSPGYNGAQRLVRIIFADWRAVYLEGHYRHVIVHDIVTGGFIVATWNKRVKDHFVAATPEEVFTQIFDRICRKDQDHVHVQS